MSVYISILYVLFCRNPNEKSIKVLIDVQHPDLIAIKPNVTFNISFGENQITYVKGLNAGHSIVSAIVNSTDVIE